MQTMWGVVLLLVSIVLVLSAVALIINIQMNKIELEEATNCPTTGPLAHHIILADNTDVYSKIQARVIKKSIQRFIRQMDINEQLSIFILDETSLNRMEPRFSKCKLRSGEDANFLTENERLLKKKRAKEFDEPAMLVIKKLLSNKREVKTSSILEMIQAARVFGLPSEPSRKRRMMIISDMVQNNNKLSFFSGFPKYDDFRTRAYAQRVKTDLIGFEIIVKMLLRAGFSRVDLLRFWEPLFQDYGALVSTFEIVEG